LDYVLADVTSIKQIHQARVRSGRIEPAQERIEEPPAGRDL